MEIESIARFPAENPNPVLRLADGRTITYANAAALAMLGGAATGLDAETTDDIARIATTALASGTMHKMEYSKGDETYLLSVVPVADRHTVNIYGKQITKRKRAEAKIRESEQQVRNLIENSPDGILVTDETGRITTWNRGMEMITGLAAGDVLGTPGWEIQARIVNEEWVGPGYRARYRAIWDRLLQDGAYQHLNRLLDVQIRIPTGEIRHLQQRVFTTPTPRGFQVGAILRDITEQKRAEEALLRFTEDLRRSNEDLERFAYVSSHDLQEPLRTIVSFSQLLERRYRGQLDAGRGRVHRVHRRGRHPDAGPDPGPARLLAGEHERAGRSTRPTRARPGRRGAQPRPALREAGATIDVTTRCRWCMADPLQLEQVFANLVSNAIKFRRPDVPLRIQVGARRMAASGEFSVSGQRDRDRGRVLRPDLRDLPAPPHQGRRTRARGSASRSSSGSSTGTAAPSGSSRRRARARPSSSPCRPREREWPAQLTLHSGKGEAVANACYYRDYLTWPLRTSRHERGPDNPDRRSGDGAGRMRGPAGRQRHEAFERALAAMDSEPVRAPPLRRRRRLTIAVRDRERAAGLRRRCLHDRVDLEIIGTRPAPGRGRGRPVLATPTLVRRLPPPLRSVSGTSPRRRGAGRARPGTVRTSHPATPPGNSHRTPRGKTAAPPSPADRFLIAPCGVRYRTTGPGRTIFMDVSRSGAIRGGGGSVVYRSEDGGRERTGESPLRDPRSR